MKQHLINFVKHPAAKVLAFVPLLHLLYLVALLLTADNRCRKQGWLVSVAIVIGTAVAFSLIPYPWSWGVTYAAISVAAFSALNSIRNYHLFENVKASTVWKRALFFGVPVLLFVGIFVGISAKADVTEKTTNMLTALVQQDEAAWDAQRMKGMGSRVGTLEEYTASLNERGISLGGEVVKKHTTGTEISVQDGNDIHVNKSYIYEIGGELYEVTVEYRAKGDLKGIFALVIQKRD